MKKERGLINRHRIFAEEYVANGGDAYKAYIASDPKGTAKIKELSIRCSASQLLARPLVAQRIKELQKVKDEETERVLAKDYGFSVRKIFSQVAYIAMNAERDSDKLKALDMMARAHKVYDQSVYAKNDTLQVVVTVPDNGRVIGGNLSDGVVYENEVDNE
jgi:hypothetical protein